MTALAAVRERIEEYRASRGGTPKAIIVSREEYLELLGTIPPLGDGPIPQPQTLRIMGVDIHVGPVTYPWGCFPTRATRGPATLAGHGYAAPPALLINGRPL